METSIYKKIIENLLDTIEKNCNTDGFKLPSEKSLATKFNSSHAPVRKAYQNLKDRGYIESIHGKGYFITKNYKAKRAAAGIAQSSKNICFITPVLKTDFIRQIIYGIQSFCDTHGLELSIKLSEQSIQKEKRFLSRLEASDIKGVIICPADNEFYNEELLRLSLKKFPIVLVDRYLKGLHLAFIASDGHKAMSDIVALLHKKQHKNITFIAANVVSAAEERINGFRYGLIKHYGNIKANNVLEIDPYNPVNQKRAMINHLKKYPDTDAVIATGADAMAVIGAAAELNIPLPEKLKLVLFDSELPESETRAASYILEQNSYGIGYEAAEILYKQIYGDRDIVTKRLPIKITDCSLLPDKA